MSQVIVISGASASGKTTLIQQLHRELQKSKVISFDDYDIDALPSASSLDTPLSEAVNQYDISRLMADFLAVYGQAPLILLDFPFGYKHAVLRPYIDKVIYLKTPLDVLLARQIIRDFADKSAGQVIDWVKNYLNFARPIFIDYDSYIAEDADVILDGCLPLEEKVNKVKTVYTPQR